MTDAQPVYAAAEDCAEECTEMWADENYTLAIPSASPGKQVFRRLTLGTPPASTSHFGVSTRWGRGRRYSEVRGKPPGPLHPPRSRSIWRNIDPRRQVDRRSSTWSTISDS